MNLGEIWGAANEQTEGERVRHHKLIDEVAEYMENRLLESGGLGRPLCEDLHLVDKKGEPDAYEYEAFRWAYYDQIKPSRAEYVHDRMDDIIGFSLMCSWLARGFAHHGLTDSAICTKLLINHNQLKAMHVNDQKAFCFAGVATVKMTLREFKKLEK